MPISPDLPITITPRTVTPPIVTTIPATVAPAKLPAAGYARTSRFWQEDSLENQTIHLEQVIRNNPDYEFIAIYSDDGISGRDAYNRPGLQALLADCRAGKVSVIITKSISRLARNVTDLLNIVHELSDIGCCIIFEREGLKTDEMHSELLLSLLAGFAASESTSIGSNVRMGHRAKFTLGTHKVFHAPYGFDKGPSGSLVVNESEAPIVREIYERVLSGEGCTRIARDLETRHIPTRKGGRWAPRSVRDITRHPAMMGMMVNQRYYISDKKAHVNRGELDMYIQEDHHAPIVEEDTYNRVQDIMGFRRQRYNVFCYEEDPDNVEFRLQRTCFSSHLFCNCCGGTLHRGSQYRTGLDVDPEIGKGWIWRCSQRTRDNSVCSMGSVNEADLKRAFCNMVNKIVYSASTDLPLLDLFIEAQITDEAERNEAALRALSEELDKIDYEQQSLIELANRYAIAPAKYHERMNSLAQRQKEIRASQVRLARSYNIRQTEKLKAMMPESMITTFDEVLFEGIVECVVVQSRQFITFELKCGLRLTEYFAGPVFSSCSDTLPPDSLSVYRPGSLIDPRITSPYDSTAADTVASTAAASTAASGESHSAAITPATDIPAATDTPAASDIPAASDTPTATYLKEDREEKPGRNLPYGYRWNGNRIEIVPEEAERLRLFFHLIAEGQSITVAGATAGIPRKGSSLSKIARRRAYGGNSHFPAIVDPKLISIRTNDGRRAPFIPLYSDFEYGVVPTLAPDISPAECISFLYQQVRPVAAYQRGVADYPMKRRAPSVKGNDAAAATVAASAAVTVPAQPIASAPTHAADQKEMPDHREGSDHTHETDHKEGTAAEQQTDDSSFILPSDKTSNRRRRVDLAIDAHNKRVRTTTASAPSTASTASDASNPSTAFTLPQEKDTVKTEIIPISISFTRPTTTPTVDQTHPTVDNAPLEADKMQPSVDLTPPAARKNIVPLAVDGKTEKPAPTPDLTIPMMVTAR